MNEYDTDFTDLERRLLAHAQVDAESCLSEFQANGRPDLYESTLNHHQRYVAGLLDAVSAVTEEPSRKGAHTHRLRDALEDGVVTLAELMLQSNATCESMKTNSYTFLTSAGALQSLVDDAVAHLRFAPRVRQTCSFLAKHYQATNAELSEHLDESYSGGGDWDKRVDAARQVAREARKKLPQFFAANNPGSTLAYRLHIDTVSFGGPWCLWYVPPERRNDLDYAGVPLTKGNLPHIFQMEAERQSHQQHVRSLDEEDFPSRLPGLSYAGRSVSLLFGDRLPQKKKLEFQNLLLRSPLIDRCNAGNVGFARTASGDPNTTIAIIFDDNPTLTWGYRSPVADVENLLSHFLTAIEVAKVSTSGVLYDFMFEFTTPGATTESIASCVDTLLALGRARYRNVLLPSESDESIAVGLNDGREVSIAYNAPRVRGDVRYRGRDCTTASVRLGITDRSTAAREPELSDGLRRARSTAHSEFFDGFVLPLALSMGRRH